MTLKCQDHVTFKILSCDCVILALMPALPGSKSNCTQSFSDLVPGPSWPQCLCSSMHQTALPGLLHMPWKPLLQFQSSVPTLPTTLISFASICKKASHTHDLEIPQTKGLLSLSTGSISIHFSHQVQLSHHPRVLRVGELLWEEVLAPSENPLVILQVINEDSGRHWARLWNVKQSGFYSGSPGFCCFRSVKEMIVLLMGVSGTSLCHPGPRPFLGLLSWSPVRVFMVEEGQDL